MSIMLFELNSATAALAQDEAEARHMDVRAVVAEAVQAYLGVPIRYRLWLNEIARAKEETVSEVLIDCVASRHYYMVDGGRRDKYNGGGV